MADHYSLPRHATESARLDGQHAVYVKSIGYLLHPRIAATLPANARIADVGTGTGIWLRDLARDSPSTWSYTGLDVSDAQFPQDGNGNGAASSQFTYETLDITQSVPERFQRRFDVVHLRLLQMGLVKGQWEGVAANVLQLLKPGGWIQWHESQFADIQLYQNVPGASVKHGRRLLDACLTILNQSGKVLGEEARLKEILGGAGFEECEEDVMSSDRVPEVRGALNTVQAGAIQGMARGLIERAGSAFPLEQGELEEAIKGMYEELEGEKMYWQWNMRIVTGRRPG